MKFVCLGYMDEGNWEAMSKSERDAFIEECFAYDDVLRDGGCVSGGAALQSAGSGVILRFQKGDLSVTDGPFAETKEQLGGFFILEADDLDHAVRLMAKHPGVRAGPFEIRPVDEEFEARANARHE